MSLQHDDCPAACALGRPRVAVPFPECTGRHAITPCLFCAPGAPMGPASVAGGRPHLTAPDMQASWRDLHEGWRPAQCDLFEPGECCLGSTTVPTLALPTSMRPLFNHLAMLRSQSMSHAAAYLARPAALPSDRMLIALRRRLRRLSPIVPQRCSAHTAAALPSTIAG